MMTAGLMHRVMWAMAFAGAVCLPAVGAMAYDGATVTDGGTITGTVRVLGDVSPLPPQPVQKHVKDCGPTVPDERLMVGPNGVLQNVVVTLVGIERGKPLPTTPVVLGNRTCAFVPHVLSASLGQTLEIVNHDPFLHDAHAWLGDRTLFNLAIPRGRTVHTTLHDPGMIHINCNVRHTWMHAYLFVAEHPYHTVTDAAGRFTITEVPAGPHRLRAVHEMLGSTEREITVRPGETVDIAIEFSPTAPEPAGAAGS